MSFEKPDPKTPSWGFSGNITVLPPEPNATRESDKAQKIEVKADQEDSGRTGR
jgi:hypothetical protein